ncbi:hypothetical protein [Streptomyces sp. NPDC007346]|uniref:hypothetical protein n=1 Tax=Streptomyces sp. NPDC007346 TaxID=3154682 RepID=UPI0034557F9E
MTAHLIGYEVACNGPAPETDCPDSAAVRPRFTSRTVHQVRADGHADGWTTTPTASGRLLDHCPTCTRTRKESR